MPYTPTITKEQYEAWATQAGSRVIGLSLMNSMTVTGDGKKLAIYEFGKIIRVNPDGQGTTINLGETGPMIKEGLVGMAGAYLHPSMVGAASCEQVVDSWNWLFDQFRHDKKDLEAHIEGMHILTFIASGVYDTVLSRTMTLAVCLKSLNDMGIDVIEKVTELNRKIIGNMRAFRQLQETDIAGGMARIKIMMDQISDALSESEIALLSAKAGMKVALGKSPDLMVDDIRVEVKHFRTGKVDEGALSNKIREGLSQGGQIIAISSNNLKEKNLRDIKLKWLPLDTLTGALMLATEFARKGKKSVLLYATTNRGPIAKVALIKSAPKG
jgi:hypothetical protein